MSMIWFFFLPLSPGFADDKVSVLCIGCFLKSVYFFYFRKIALLLSIFCFAVQKLMKCKHLNYFRVEIANTFLFLPYCCFEKLLLATSLYYFWVQVFGLLKCSKMLCRINRQMPKFRLKEESICFFFEKQSSIIWNIRLFGIKAFTTSNSNRLVMFH